MVEGYISTSSHILMIRIGYAVDISVKHILLCRYKKSFKISNLKIAVEHSNHFKFCVHTKLINTNWFWKYLRCASCLNPIAQIHPEQNDLPENIGQIQLKDILIFWIIRMHIARTDIHPKNHTSTGTHSIENPIW